MLRFHNVSRRFGGLVAIDNVTVDIAAGELVGLVGPNGAGKSTMFNLACGYLHPSAGTVALDGRNIAGQTPHALARRGLSRTFQTPVAFPELSALDNVVIGAPVERPLASAITGRWRAREDDRRSDARVLLDRVGLSERADVGADELSGGELRMLEVARQLLMRPRMLLLDEPTAGVAPHLQDNLGELILSVHAEGVAVIVVEHNLGFLLNLVDRVLCLATGTIIADSSPMEIRNDPAVVSAYLGGHA